MSESEPIDTNANVENNDLDVDVNDMSILDSLSDEEKILIIRNFPLDEYGVGLTDSDVINGWNRGFFSGDEKLGERERNVTEAPIWLYSWLVENDRMEEAAELLFEISRATGISFEDLKSERYNMSAYFDKDPKDYKYLEKGNRNSGWNMGFFKGQETMGEPGRKVHWPGQSPDDFLEKQHIVDTSRGQYDSTDDDEYASEAQRLAAENMRIMTSLLWTDESMDDVLNISDKNNAFVDKDNYERFLDLKRTTDIVPNFLEFIVVYVYFIVFWICVIWEVYMMVTKNEEGPFPNWTILIVPMVLYVIYKSVNSYSPIKISW